MIQYVKGDVTRPILDHRPGLLVHVSNDLGGWGRGLVIAISKRWPQPEAAYRKWHMEGISENGIFFELGNVQPVRVESNLIVVNMLAQTGYGNNNRALHQTDEPNSTPPIRYVALEQCLEKVAILARTMDATVHGGRFGSGLAGGSWVIIEGIINRTLHDVPVTIYDL